MMKIEVKLYSYHDMDLVSLYKSGRVAFPETTRQILNSYANKEVYKIKLLQINQKRLDRYPRDSYRKYYHYYIILDDKEDFAAIELLKKITPGYRNNFIKVVLRQYLCCALSSGYSINGDTKLFREMTHKFQGSLDEREIKQTKKIKMNTHNKERNAVKKSSHIKHKEPIQEIVTPEAQKTTFQSSQTVAYIAEEQSKQSQKESVPKKENFISEPIHEPKIESELESDDGFDIDDFLTGATEQY